MLIYLASKSPRRQELLKQMGVKFEVLDIDIPEEINPHEAPLDYSKRITHEKLLAAWQCMLDRKLHIRPILCADTEVVMNNTIYGKPKDKNDAYRMLESYSNNHHEVITSVGIKFHDLEQIKTQTTTVYIGTLTTENINNYLALHQYQDKAGAYGIQSYFGQFIQKIEGCFYSVMGLPLYQTKMLLEHIQIKTS
jgi:septum formation protein